MEVAKKIRPGRPGKNGVIKTEVVRTRLRPYQADLIARARSEFAAGIKSLLIQAPTGAGKTILTAHMFSQAMSKGLSSIFCVHRR